MLHHLRWNFGITRTSAVMDLPVKSRRQEATAVTRMSLTGGLLAQHSTAVRVAQFVSHECTSRLGCQKLPVLTYSVDIGILHVAHYCWADLITLLWPVSCAAAFNISGCATVARLEVLRQVDDSGGLTVRSQPTTQVLPGPVGGAGEDPRLLPPGCVAPLAQFVAHSRTLVPDWYGGREWAEECAGNHA